MSSKITSEHLCRGAAVYIRQSTLSQVLENTESQRRQYELAEAARAAGFASVTVIDDDLGRSGSGAAERPGFQKLAASVCAGSVGAVYCIEASRLARNGRDWHHLIDLCALAGALVVDPDGVYDPRLVNDRLLLGLKGTMSEYELSLLRQRGLAARDAKAGRGELRFTLPPGYCWGENGRIEIDPDERVAGVIRLVFEKFRELGSSRQLYLWFLAAGLSLPVVRRNAVARHIEWRPAAYHTIHQILKSPIYAGTYAFGRTAGRTRIVDGRARKTDGHKRPMADWGVLLRDNHEGYITWKRFEEKRWPQCGSAFNTRSACAASPGNPLRMSVTPQASHTRTDDGTGIIRPAPGQPGTARQHRTTRSRSPGGRSTTRSRSDLPMLRPAPAAPEPAPPPPAGRTACLRHRPPACSGERAAAARRLTPLAAA